MGLNCEGNCSSVRAVPRRKGGKERGKIDELSTAASVQRRGPGSADSVRSRFPTALEYEVMIDRRTAGSYMRWRWPSSGWSGRLAGRKPTPRIGAKLAGRQRRTRGHRSRHWGPRRRRREGDVDVDVEVESVVEEGGRGREGAKWKAQN